MRIPIWRFDVTRPTTFLVIGAAAAALAVAGCGGGGGGGTTSSTAAAGGAAGSTGATGSTGSTGSTSSGGGGGGETLTIAADSGGALAFDKKTLSAKAGKVTIKMDNPSQLPHGVGIKGNGVDKDGPIVQPGDTSTLTLNLQPGDYDFYCPFDSHEDMGMKGTLTVK